MSKKLYVGNLPYDVDNDRLLMLFATCGKVRSASIVMDRETNRSKGFGFVEMETEEAGKDAINSLDRTDYNGRTLTVNAARPKNASAGPPTAARPAAPSQPDVRFTNRPKAQDRKSRDDNYGNSRGGDDYGNSRGSRRGRRDDY